MPIAPADVTPDLIRGPEGAPMPALDAGFRRHDGGCMRPDASARSINIPGTKIAPKLGGTFNQRTRAVRLRPEVKQQAHAIKRP